MATIDLTLNGIKIPALDGYTPPFGTKKASGGLTTQEVNDNIIAPFVKDRPIEITEDSSTGGVEYNASLVITGANAVLTLGSGTYAGCTVKVIAATAGSVSYNSGTTDTLVAGQIVNYTWTGSAWINLDKELKNQMFPIGYIYISTNATSPANLFGGTWEQIQDTFLLACGTTYQAGATGGEAEHTLTISEMPSHTHIQNPHKHAVKNTGTSGGNYGLVDSTNASSSGMMYTSDETPTNRNTGGGQAHNNMPPYTAVYMWKKTAD